MNVARLIYRDITRNAFRSDMVFGCAVLLSALPFGVTVITEGSRAGLQLVLERLGADLLVVPQGAEVKVETALLTGKPTSVWMPRENLEKVARAPGVARTTPQLHLATLAGAPCCSASELFIVAFDPGTDFTLRAWLKDHLGAELGLGEVVGGSLVFVPNGKANILIYGSPVRLKGNLARSGTGLDQTLFLTFETARAVAHQSKIRAEKELVIPADRISTILVQLKPGAAPEQVAAAILQAVPGVAVIQSPAFLQATRQELAGWVRILVGVLALVWLLSMAVAGLVFSLAAQERRRELGVLRALGSSRGFVLRLLLAEAAMVAVAGAASGIALCLTLAIGFQDAIVFLLRIPFLFPPLPLLAALMLGGLLVSVASVTLSALMPAWRISHLDPAWAMRE
jgi:putative ABC transport system permease protein